MAQERRYPTKDDIRKRRHISVPVLNIFKPHREEAFDKKMEAAIDSAMAPCQLPLELLGLINEYVGACPQDKDDSGHLWTLAGGTVLDFLYWRCWKCGEMRPTDIPLR